MKEQKRERMQVIADEQFSSMCIDVQLALGITGQEMADVLQVSGPTFSRWKKGQNLPHQTMRRSILRAFDSPMRLRADSD